MVEYPFKSGGAPRNTERLMTMLKRHWANKQTLSMFKLVPYYLIDPQFASFRPGTSVLNCRTTKNEVFYKGFFQ